MFFFFSLHFYYLYTFRIPCTIVMITSLYSKLISSWFSDSENHSVLWSPIRCPQAESEASWLRDSLLGGHRLMEDKTLSQLWWETPQIVYSASQLGFFIHACDISIAAVMFLFVFFSNTAFRLKISTRDEAKIWICLSTPKYSHH